MLLLFNSSSRSLTFRGPVPVLFEWCCCWSAVVVFCPFNDSQQLAEWAGAELAVVAELVMVRMLISAVSYVVSGGVLSLVVVLVVLVG